MSVIVKRFVVLLFFAPVFFTSGCFNQKNSVEKLHTILERVVASERGFEAQQEPITTLEKQDKITYEQIIGLGMKQYNQIDKLADKAIKNVNSRKDYMEQETKSLKDSEKKFQKVADLKSQISNPKLRKIANQLYDLMEKRYKAHDALYKEYVKGLLYDKELYLMFKNKNLPLSDLQLQVTKINNIYDNIFTANQNFNKYTEEYNSKKLLFYKEAGFKAK